MNVETDQSQEGNDEFNQTLVHSQKWVTDTLTHFCGPPLAEGSLLFGQVKTLLVHDTWMARLPF